MKNTIIFLVFLFSFQLGSAQDFSFGFTVEPTTSWVTSDDQEVNSDGTNLGFKFGIVGEKAFSDNFGFAAGLKVGFGLGGTLKHDNGGKLLPESELSRELKPLRDNFPANTSIQYKVGTFEIPLSFKIQSNQIGYIKYFAEFPIITLGILTGAKADISSSTINSTDENVLKDVSTLFLNWGVGGGIEYEVSSGTVLVAGLYYNANLNDFTTDEAKRTIIVSEMESFQETEDSKGVMKQISLRIGVRF